MNIPQSNIIKGLLLSVGILLVVDLLFLFFFYFHPVEHQDGLRTLFFAVILCGLNVFVGMMMKGVWRRAFILNGILLFFGIQISAALSTNLHWNYWHTDYSIEVNDSTFELQMDRKEKKFSISYYEKPYDVGYYVGNYTQKETGVYSLDVDTLYSVKKDLFHFELSNDILLGFRSKPIKIEQTSIKVSPFFIKE